MCRGDIDPIDLVLCYSRQHRSHSGVADPQALYRNLAELPEPLRVEFELRVAEGPFCRSFHLSDRELANVLRLPGKVAMTIDTLCHADFGYLRATNVYESLSIVSLTSIPLVAHANRTSAVMPHAAGGAHDAARHEHAGLQPEQPGAAVRAHVAAAAAPRHVRRRPRRHRLQVTLFTALSASEITEPPATFQDVAKAPQGLRHGMTI